MRSGFAKRRVWVQWCVLAALWLASPPPAAVAYEKEVKTIASEMAEKIRGAGKRTIAVVDFTDLQSNVTELGRFLAEETSVALAGAGQGFEVVERSNLASILKEQKLSATSLIDQITARKVGKIAGVEALILGSLTPFGDSIRLSVKILDTNTAKMIGSASTNVAKIGAIDELLKKGVVVAGGAVPSGSATSSGGKNPTVAKPIEVKKFIFDLQGCELSGQTISCWLLVKNSGPDRYLKIYQTSRLVDDQGNDYSPTEAAIANSSAKFRWGGDDIEQVLIYDVPVRTSLTFNGILPEATRVSSLALIFGVGDDYFPVEFRNVSLDQKVVPSLASGISGGASALAGGDESTLTGAVAGTVRQELKERSKDAAKAAVRKLFKNVLKVPLPDPVPPDGD